MNNFILLIVFILFISLQKPSFILADSPEFTKPCTVIRQGDSLFYEWSDVITYDDGIDNLMLGNTTVYVSSLDEVHYLRDSTIQTVNVKYTLMFPNGTQEIRDEFFSLMNLYLIFMYTDWEYFSHILNDNEVKELESNTNWRTLYDENVNNKEDTFSYSYIYFDKENGKLDSWSSYIYDKATGIMIYYGYEMYTEGENGITYTTRHFDMNLTDTELQDGSLYCLPIPNSSSNTNESRYWILVPISLLLPIISLIKKRKSSI